jgi:hypothetical protein
MMSPSMGILLWHLPVPLAYTHLMPTPNLSPHPFKVHLELPKTHHVEANFIYVSQKI